MPLPPRMHSSFRNLKFLAGVFVLAALAPLHGLAAEPRLRPLSEVEFSENIEYGKAGDESLTLHLARPKDLEEPVPGILYIHGGGWARGNKDQLKNAIRQAARRGYVAVSVGYRFAPEHPFPAQIEDVKCAVRWMRANADRLKVNPDAIGAIGFSAGAHLSMMLGAMDPSDGLEGDAGSPNQSSKVQAVVAHYGPTDLSLEFPERTVDILDKFVGGTKETKSNELRLASPMIYVNEGDAPMLLFHGTVDPLVPYDQAFIMANALTKAHVPGRVELIVGGKHGWDPEENKRVTQVGYDFFDEWLKK